MNSLQWGESVRCLWWKSAMWSYYKDVYWVDQGTGSEVSGDNRALQLPLLPSLYGGIRKRLHRCCLADRLLSGTHWLRNSTDCRQHPPHPIQFEKSLLGASVDMKLICVDNDASVSFIIVYAITWRYTLIIGWRGVKIIFFFDYWYYSRFRHLLSVCASFKSSTAYYEFIVPLLASCRPLCC